MPLKEIKLIKCFVWKLWAKNGFIKYLLNHPTLKQHQTFPAFSPNMQLLKWEWTKSASQLGSNNIHIIWGKNLTG